MKDNLYKSIIDKTLIDESTEQRIKDRIYMMKFNIQVGTNEKHVIDFSLNQFVGFVEIIVDGVVVVQKMLTGGLFKQSWTFKFTVGNIEKHDIKVELVKSIFPVGLKECTAWVYVDNEKAYDYTGTLSISNMLFGWISPLMKRIVVSVGVSLLVLITLIMTVIIIYSWPHKIDKTIEGVLYRAGDYEYSEKMNLVIDGHYSRSLFKGDEFIGAFYIEGFDLGPGIDATDAHITFGSLSGGHLYYFDKGNNVGSGIVTLGSAFMDRKGNAVSVNIYDDFLSNIKTWDSGDGLIFAAPAKNRSQAVELTNELMEELLRKDIE